jgi:nitrous oxidase accessory protein NosD
MLTQRAIQNGLLFLVAFCSWSHAATLTVGPATCPNATYATIGTALNAAAAGDEIDICPGTYPEQLVIIQPVTLRGLSAYGVNRVLIQPTSLYNVGTFSFTAVISVVNTQNVVIEGLAIDTSMNTVSGCTELLAGIHFYNASGAVVNNAISGAQLPTPTSCTTLFPGNGFGVEVDTATGQTGPFSVSISGNSIHDFNRDGILVNGAGITADISGNSISGVGPSTGYNQFGIFIALGAVGHVTHNTITMGNCGSIALASCVPLRSEGVVFRAAGDGSVVDSNFIANAQSGVFLNGANNVQITNNVIMNIDALDGIDVQGSAAGHFTNSVISGNTISHVFPISSYSSTNGYGCGINEYSGTGVAMNLILNNTVNDAYCGVAYVTADQVYSGVYTNALYATLNADLYPTTFPPAVEP